MILMTTIACQVVTYLKKFKIIHKIAEGGTLHRDNQIGRQIIDEISLWISIIQITQFIFVFFMMSLFNSFDGVVFMYKWSCLNIVIVNAFQSQSLIESAHKIFRQTKVAFMVVQSTINSPSLVQKVVYDFEEVGNQ